MPRIGRWRAMWTRATLAVFVAVSVGFPAGAVLASEPDRRDLRPGCVACHGSPVIASEHGERLYVSGDALQGSAHESIGCSCHPPVSPAVHANIASELRATRSSCPRCHEKEARSYLAGAHVQRGGTPRLSRDGSAVRVGARCIVCHGAHRVESTTAGFLPAAGTRGQPSGAVAVGLALAGAIAFLLGGWLLARRSTAGRALLETRTAARARRGHQVAATGDGRTRREFLGLVGAATAGAAVAALGPAEPARAASDHVRELADEHGDDPAVLIDVTRCVGCGSCAAACKLSNDLEWRDDQPWVARDATLSSTNWCVVREVALPEGSGRDVAYVKRQCMHCLEPTCVSVCPVTAMQKQSLGPVTYDANRCIGCRYCLMACPFGVPTFAWDRPIAEVSKCNLCFERVAGGEPTACASVCPAGAISFGPRKRMLVEAWRRIDAEPERYLRHVYGETEAGGTSVLYVSDVSFSALGLPTGVPGEPPPEYTWEISRLVPPFAGGVAALLLALYARRREAIEGHVTEEFGLREQDPGEAAIGEGVGL